MLPLKESPVFKLATVFTQKKILIELPDGGKAMVAHKRINVVCVHKASGHKMILSVTGKYNHSRQCANPETGGLEKEERITESDMVGELDRFLGKGQGRDAYDAIKVRLILGL